MTLYLNQCKIHTDTIYEMEDSVSFYVDDRQWYMYKVVIDNIKLDGSTQNLNNIKINAYRIDDNVHYDNVLVKGDSIYTLLLSVIGL